MPAMWNSCLLGEQRWGAQNAAQLSTKPVHRASNADPRNLAPLFVTLTALPLCLRLQWLLAPDWLPEQGGLPGGGGHNAPQGA